MVTKHGGSSQELQGAEESVATEVEHGEGGPSHPDLDEYEADLCLGGVGQGGFRVGTGSMHEGAEGGGGCADEDDEACGEG